MGGFTGLVEDVFKTLSESSVGQWLKPAMREMEGTAAGTQVTNILKNQFEPEVAETTAFYRTKLGYAPPAATKAAVEDISEKYFGKRGEGVINILKAVNVQSGGNKIHVNNFADALDVYFGEKGIKYPNWRLQAINEKVPLYSSSSSYKPPGPVERFTKDVASWIFLPRIVIPHTTQPLNVLLYEGAKSFGKATEEMFANGLDAAKKRVIDSGVLEDQILYQMIDTAKGGGLARKLFHMPAFNYLRDMQIAHSALAGEFTVLEAFDDQLANGMTPKLELAFRRHGIDPASLKGLKQLTPEMIKTAQYRAAQATYFMRSGLDTPYPWSQNWMSRTATMYKHFGYNQGRFVVSAINDSFRVSPEEGIKTVAILSTLYPIAGYAVAKVEDAINLRPAPTNAQEKDAFYSEYISAIGHAAGFGIAYSIFRSAKRNALADYAIGPIPSTITDFAQDILNAPTSESRRRKLGRDTLRRIPLVGPGISQELLPKKKAGRKSRISDVE